MTSQYSLLHCPAATRSDCVTAAAEQSLRGQYCIVGRYRTHDSSRARCGGLLLRMRSVSPCVSGPDLAGWRPGVQPGA